MNARMERFFGVMSGFLAGDSTAADVERTLGPSASGTARLALYQELVTRQRRDVLDALFPAVSRACREIRAGLWDELTSAFTRQHPPTHWEPNRFGAAFSDFLADRREADASLPAYLEELADYAFVRFAVSVAVEPSDGVGLDASLFVRRYEHDVVALTRAVDSAGATASTAAPCTLIVAWSHTSHAVIELSPSLAILAAIGRRLGDARAQERPDAPAEADVDAADRELVVRGVLLAPRTVGAR